MDSDRLRFVERLPLLRDRPAVSYGIAIAMSLVAGGLRSVLDPVFPPGFPFLTFFPAVILASFLLGTGPGITAAALCGAIAWYFFIPPFDSFGLDGPSAVALLFYSGVVAVDITLVQWIQSANRRLFAERERSRMLAERSALLFGELQHRVSNNIQMVGAVLALQKRGVVDPAARQALDDAAARMQVIGGIQRQLYDVTGQPVSVATFLTDLVADLVDGAGRPGVTHRVEAQSAVMLEPDSLIPIALIVAEAVANAIEHGFAGCDHGHVTVSLIDQDGTLALSVGDDGVGLPAGFDATTRDSLGLKIASTLARQLKGMLAVEPQAPRGTVTRLVIPAGVATRGA